MAEPQPAAPQPAVRPAVPPVPMEGVHELRCPHQPSEENIPRLEIDVAGGAEGILRALRILYKRELDISPFFVIVDGVIVPVTPLPNKANAAGLNKVSDLSSHHILALWSSENDSYKADLLVRDEDLYYVAWRGWRRTEPGVYVRGRWWRFSGKGTHPVPAFLNAWDSKMNSTHGGYLPHRFNFLENILFQLGKFETEVNIKKPEFVEAQHNAMVFFFEPRRLYAMLHAMNNTLYHILPTAEESRILNIKIHDWNSFSNYVLRSCKSGIIALDLLLPKHYQKTYNEEIKNMAQLIGNGANPGELLIIRIDKKLLMLTEEQEAFLRTPGHGVPDYQFNLAAGAAGQPVNQANQAAVQSMGQAEIIFSNF